MAARPSEERQFHDRIDGADQDRPETDFFLNQAQPRWALKSGVASGITVFTKVMAIVNLLLMIVLGLSIGIVAHLTTKACPQGVSLVIEPYSPAHEAVVPVVKRFKPELIFQSETSPKVEEVWAKIQGASDGIVALGPEESAKLSNQRHDYVDPDSPDGQFYGVSMYKQLRCLNIIRRSFHREKFFPNLTDEMFHFQKNHCFDFLRQVIQCHGDVMAYLWDKTRSADSTDNPEESSDWYESH